MVMEEHEIMTDIKQLKLTANRNRKRIVEMVYQAGVGHVGGALSVIDPRSVARFQPPVNPDFRHIEEHQKRALIHNQPIEMTDRSTFSPMPSSLRARAGR